MALDHRPREPRHWHLALLKPGGLSRAIVNLERQGITTFMPRREVTRRRSGRLTGVSRPLFPGYLFLQALPGCLPWRSINSTFGVARLVSFGTDGPAEVPQALMSDLFAHVDANDTLVPFEELRVGDRVRIISGAFASFLARIEEVPESGRIYALLEIMGRDVRTSVLPAQVERL